MVLALLARNMRYHDISEGRAHHDVARDITHEQDATTATTAPSNERKDTASQQE